jgi:tRNA (cmo5U34)-methyltransferase
MSKLVQDEKPQNTNGDSHIADPNRKWEFDKDVTDAFSMMISSSIPDCRNMRKWVQSLASNHLRTRVDPEHMRGVTYARTGSALDIGASRGDAVADLVADYPMCRFHLVEISEPMLAVLRQRFDDSPNVRLVAGDMSEEPTLVNSSRQGHDLAMSILTLMFVPIECRQRVVQAVYDSLLPGGMFIVVEKTIGETVVGQELLVSQYHAFKMASGYTAENVERKRLSLKGALVPTKPSWVEEMLRDAGFVHVTRFWQALQFVGWVAYKK